MATTLDQSKPQADFKPSKADWLAKKQQWARDPVLWVEERLGIPKARLCEGEIKMLEAFRF